MDINSTIYRKAFIDYVRRGIPFEVTYKAETKKAAKEPVQYYIWHTQGDNKVRASHRAKEGQIFSTDESPKPGEESGCRCWAEPYYGDIPQDYNFAGHKTIYSLEKQIVKHESKLAEYIKNPYKFDNKDFLKNTPNDEIRQKIIEGRIYKLQKEIEKFKNEIFKITNGRKL